GIDKIVDNADITAFTYKGENFDLDYVTPPVNDNSGSLSWTFGSETNIDGDIVNQVTVTDSSDNSVLVFRSNGYYNFTPDQAALATPITELFTDGSTGQGITVTTTDNGNPVITYNASNNSGIGVNSTGDTWSDSADRGDNVILSFDAVTYPNGVEDISLDFRFSTGAANAIFYDGPNATGNIIATIALTGADIQLFTGVSGVASVEVSTGNNGDYSIQGITFTPIVVAPSLTVQDPILINYTLTDSDGQSDTAQLSLYTIDNTITGTVNADSINGGSDNDAIIGDAGDDVLAGNAGHDTLAGGAGLDVLSGGDGQDNLSGGDGNDSLDGDAGNDHLAGDAGDDILDGGLGSDILLGGSGNDLLFGGAGDDQLDGGEGDDQLTGGAGDDILAGGAGEDTLIGGQGDDVMTGGAGLDTFVWRGGDDGSTSQPAIDIVNDFDNSQNGDVLDLSDLLVGEESNPLTDYLSFQFTDTDGDGDSETVINIDADGGTIFETTQQVILESVDLTEGGSLTTDQDILNNLLIKNALVID
ncbi:MAG: type I secretion C-terminal target domain-containing protein, partial [Gammaproteobacteria bacterium]